jgi:hypothetical protein
MGCRTERTHADLSITRGGQYASCALVIISALFAIMRLLLIVLALTGSSASIQAPARRGQQKQSDLIASKKVEPKPPAVLGAAFPLAGVSMSAAWTHIVRTTIRSNQPQGAMMPCMQHGLFARMGSLAAIPIIYSCYATLTSASKESWESLGSTTCRRLNLALATAAAGSALWVGFAPIITQIPGSNPLVSHQAYKGATRAALIGAYGSAAALSAAVWARSLPEDVRGTPLAWPKRVADGVTKSLFSLAPKDINDPVNVKYAALSTSFLILTALQLGSHPLAVVPSWTGRRCSRHWAAWTFLAATTSFDLKEARENGKLLVDKTCHTLSSGLTQFGLVYTAATAGKIFLDPSFPVHYPAVKMVPTWATAAIGMIGLTLRPDTP